MTLYAPGPYEVEIFYVENGLTHKHRLNCSVSVEGDAGDPFSEFFVTKRDGSEIALNTALDAYLAVWKANLASSTNITIANLWRYDDEAGEKVFLSTINIAAVGGIAGSGSANHQTILTFRTQGGHGMRIELLEDGNTLSSRVPIDDAATALKNLANYVIGATNWIIARDGTYPIGKLNVSQGQNEAIFKRRNR